MSEGQPKTLQPGMIAVFACRQEIEGKAQAGTLTRLEIYVCKKGEPPTPTASPQGMPDDVPCLVPFMKRQVGVEKSIKTGPGTGSRRKLIEIRYPQ